MKQEEFDFIKDAFSQIIDDVAGNPDWHDVAAAVSADLGALERELEEKLNEVPLKMELEVISWKPSKEQLEALQHAIDCLDMEWDDHPEELDSLINDLKRLRNIGARKSMIVKD